MARNEIAPITVERAESSDDFRAQVRFREINEKLTYALLHGHMSVYNPQTAARSRDAWRAMILTQVIEASKKMAWDKHFKLSLHKFVEAKTAPEYREQAQEILKGLGLWE